MPTTRSYPSILLDTNILIRASSSGDPQQQSTIAVLKNLIAAGSVLHICPQNMQEYRQVATRPTAANGLGRTSSDVAIIMNRFEAEFEIIPETVMIYPIWRQIVEASQASGRANFDARLVAVAKAAGVDAVLTFEAGAFAKYASVTFGVSILHPQDV